MQVSKISFNGVYRENNKQFSPAQYKISENIINTLTSMDYADNHGVTPDTKFKAKGYDTLLLPVENDCVDVYAVRDFKQGIGLQPHEYSKNVYVGTYNSRSLFSSNDIKRAIKDRTILSYALFVPVALFMAMLGASTLKKCTNIIKPQYTKTAIPDSIKKTDDKVFNDSLKILKK